MKTYSSKKCVLILVIYVALFAFTVLLGLFFSCLEGEQANLLLGLSIGAIIGGAIFLLPAVVYLIWFVQSHRKSQKISPRTGTITNWDVGFFRFLGNVSVAIDDKTYSTPSYFRREEARELVGKTVSYCTVGETLYIFEVMD